MHSPCFDPPIATGEANWTWRTSKKAQIYTFPHCPFGGCIEIGG
ncbi:hypothetical protein HMPREF3213_01238 [Heyndrickxia coagulans]|uniref:Uncharacterized protein n=1 Tax=Heyndrickxia coagulans TaxID=1398 RepID=A0A133KV94_HEYCO|nr:hypothetical protein HMPREF3213_01238 [Heyndrickxia coagulans]